MEAEEQLEGREFFNRVTLSTDALLLFYLFIIIIIIIIFVKHTYHQYLGWRLHNQLPKLSNQ